MLTTVEARTSQGDLLVLPMQDISSGFAIEEIEGLDPVNATLVSSSFANLAGEQYQSSRREKRNIVIKLSLQPDYSGLTVRQLRNLLYGYFMPKSEVFLRFYMDDDDPVNISGRIESFAAPLFTETPEVTISIVCFDPDFVADDSTVISGFSVTDLTETFVPYPGTIETGFAFTFKVNRSVNGFTITNRTADNVSRQLECDALLQTGDILNISTIAGQKGATLVRNSHEASVLYSVTPYSDWLQLYPGENNIRIYAAGSGAIPFFLEYTTRFGGL